MPRVPAPRQLLPYALLGLVVLGSMALPGAALLGEWESFTVYSTFGDADAHLQWAVAPRGNIGGQGYALLELSRLIVEQLGVHPSIEAMRFPVVVCGGISLVLLFVVARRWFGPWPALIAASLLAVNPVFSQYQHELIIAGPSLMAFLLVIERLQYLAARPAGWLRWLALAGSLALVLLLYGPGRILAVGVVLAWAAKVLATGRRREGSLPVGPLLLRMAAAAAATAIALVALDTRNVKFLGPSLLFPRNSENFVVSGSPLSPVDVVLTNARVTVESLLLGGGPYHSGFVEATLIQGRFPVIPLALVPLVVAGLVLAGLRLRAVRTPLDSPYAAILALAALTCLPMLTSSVQLLEAGSTLGRYVVGEQVWQATLVNYRLVYFLVPAYLAVAVLSEWTLRRGRWPTVVAGGVSALLVVVGAWGLLQSRSAFAERVHSADPALSGDAGLSQWLEGYSLQDKPILWASHFQQHGQYAAWAAAAASALAATAGTGAVTIVPTSVGCFPEAPLTPLSLGDINARNYHQVFLAAYLSSSLPDTDVGFVFVPPMEHATDIVGEKTGQYSALLEQAAPGRYDYAGHDSAGAFIRGLGGPDPWVIVTTTPVELALAQELLRGSGREFDVLGADLPCWSSSPPAPAGTSS